MFFKSSKLYQVYSLAVGTAELKVLKWPYLKTLTWLYLWLNITLQWFPSPALCIEKVTLILCFASHRKPLDGCSQQFMWWKVIFWEHSLNCSLNRDRDREIQSTVHLRLFTDVIPVMAFINSCYIWISLCVQLFDGNSDWSAVTRSRKWAEFIPFGRHSCVSHA